MLGSACSSTAGASARSAWRRLFSLLLLSLIPISPLSSLAAAQGNCPAGSFFCAMPGMPEMGQCCPNVNLCEAGVCVTPTPTPTPIPPCPAGELRCETGMPEMPGACCPANGSCNAGACILPTPTPTPCPGGSPRCEMAGMPEMAQCCPPGNLCVAGACVAPTETPTPIPACAPGEIRCDSGMPGMPGECCPANGSCSAGACILPTATPTPCPGGSLRCEMAGMPEMAQCCPPGNLCVAGACVAPTETPTPTPTKTANPERWLCNEAAGHVCQMVTLQTALNNFPGARVFETRGGCLSGCTPPAGQCVPLGDGGCVSTAEGANNCCRESPVLPSNEFFPICASYLDANRCCIINNEKGCTKNQDCCAFERSNAICVDNKCCHGYGSLCGQDSDCCSADGTQLFCVGSNCRKRVEPGTYGCDANEDCIGSPDVSCNRGRCCKKYLYQCTTDFECCSGNCTGGFCKPRCGSASVEGTEECDNGKSCVNADGSRAPGFSFVCSTDEDCAAHNLPACRMFNYPEKRTCEENCKATPTCGDGRVNGNEQCDTGGVCKTAAPSGPSSNIPCNPANGQFCPAMEYCKAVDSATCTRDCKNPSCGDGVVQPPEVCDDGGRCQFSWLYCDRSHSCPWGLGDVCLPNPNPDACSADCSTKNEKGLCCICEYQDVPQCNYYTAAGADITNPESACPGCTFENPPTNRAEACRALKINGITECVWANNKCVGRFKDYCFGKWRFDNEGKGCTYTIVSDQATTLPQPLNQPDGATAQIDYSQICNNFNYTRDGHGRGCGYFSGKVNGCVYCMGGGCSTFTDNGCSVFDDFAAAEAFARSLPIPPGVTVRLEAHQAVASEGCSSPLTFIIQSTGVVTQYVACDSLGFQEPYPKNGCFKAGESAKCTDAGQVVTRWCCPDPSLAGEIKNRWRVEECN